MAEKHAGGRPRTFNEPQEIVTLFDAYIADCSTRERFANIAGFCRFIGINKDTYYEYAKRVEFTDCIKAVDGILEDETLNSKDHPSMKIFYLKNKFGYADKVETVNTNTNLNADVSNLTDEELQAKIDNLRSDS